MAKCVEGEASQQWIYDSTKGTFLQQSGGLGITVDFGVPAGAFGLVTATAKPSSLWWSPDVSMGLIHGE